MARHDYYEVLGISRTADDAEIKKAFRQLAMKHHPDRNPGDKAAEERFKAINEAYAILSDPDRRAQYDRFGRVDLPPGGIDLGGFGDLFEDIFEGFFSGGAGRAGSRSRARRGDDLRYDLEITLEDAAKGLETRLQIPRLEGCEACKGSGLEPGSKRVPCPTCKGRGQLRYQQGFLTVARACPHCSGEGQINRNPCKTCAGEGRVAHERTLRVRIPAGVEDGTQLRLTGEGEGGLRGGPAGDLYVVVHVREHAFFARHGSDLVCNLPLTFPQAALGAVVDVPVLEGTAKLEVPPGTQNGEVVRLRGKGMPALHGRGRGDACYRVIVEVPTKLTPRQKELLEEFERGTTPAEQGPLVGGFLDSLKKLLGG
ncbi:MAG TPA: molecular chaperone DnaJ [Methylomirabilota bacterium]|nr:molecular chaperone DnaJ [Methylomirabilota bacterium]